MEIVIEQCLRYVHRRQVELLGFVFKRHNELVTRAPVGESELEARISQAGHQVIRIERRVLCNTLHAVATEHAHVNIGTQ